MSSPDTARVTPRPVLLVVEDDPAARSPLWSELAASYELVFVPWDQAGDRIAEARAELVLCDVGAGDPQRAFELRERLTARGPAPPMAILAARGDEATAVEALHRGFVDYLRRREGEPRFDLLRRRIETAVELGRLRRENERLQRAIEESQARLFNVYDSLDDVIMQIDHDCTVVSLNRSAAALANIEPKDGVGKTCWQLFSFHPCEQRGKKESCPIYRTFLEGETIRGERRDEKSKAVTQFMTFITTLKGQDYTVYRETDITEKRRLEEKIAAALRSLGAAPEGE
jgi:FixJ family two-component response regulator